MKCIHCGHEFLAGETAKVVILEDELVKMCEKCFPDWMWDRLGVVKTYHEEVRHEPNRED